MTLQEFVTKYSGSYVDFDHAYGAQCEDLANQWATEGLGSPPFTGNAVDAWSRYDPALYAQVANSPSNFPAPGDIVVWTGPNPVVFTGIYGHIAVALHGDAGGFVSLDQNWPEGSPVHEQGHTYDAVLGWLHPLKAVPVPPPAPPPPSPHTKEEYAAASWLSTLEGMCHGVHVADAPTKKAQVKAWLQTHG